MQFPSFPYVLKAAAIALLLAALAYVLVPETGFAGEARADYAIVTAIAALLGAWLTAMRRGEGAAAAKGDGETTTIFVGNLAFKATEEELKSLFVAFGPVTSARILRDRKTRKPRGYGFVEMPAGPARRAIAAMDGKEVMGRKLRVREGKGREDRDDDAG